MDYSQSMNFKDSTQLNSKSFFTPQSQLSQSSSSNTLQNNQQNRASYLVSQTKGVLSSTSNGLLQNQKPFIKQTEGQSNPIIGNQDQYSENSTCCGSEENNPEDFLDNIPFPQLSQINSVKQGLAAKKVKQEQQLTNQNNQAQSKLSSNNISSVSAGITNSNMISGIPQLSEEAKYKTEMCKNWIESGKCSYGEKCKFAHGKLELVQKTAVNKHFKTKNCKQFFETGRCTYGPRCHFLHEIKSIFERNENTFYTKRIFNPDAFFDLSCTQKQEKRLSRLPCFENFSCE